jgi:hypothetical protein
VKDYKKEMYFKSFNAVPLVKMTVFVFVVNVLNAKFSARGKLQKTS